MKHRTDRWDRFSKQPEIGKLIQRYTFERFEAINGSAIDIQHDERISLRTKRNIKDHTRRDHEELDSAGGVGCYLSHVTIWKKFMERPEPYAIIFEDDASLPAGFAERLQTAMKDTTLLPKVPDIWSFMGTSDFYYQYKGTRNPDTVKEMNLGPWTVNPCTSFTGYLISKHGAEKLLETAFPIDMHVDLYTCLVAELGQILRVSHKNVRVTPYALKISDTDIQPDKGCTVCDVPTQYHQKGYILLNIPVTILAVGVIAGMAWLAKGAKRR